MKDQILKLRQEGKTYNEIKSILGCSKGTISYYLGKNQKEKTDERRKRRRTNTLIRKTDSFIHRKNIRNNNESIRKFQKRDNKSKGKLNLTMKKSFTWKDVIEKFGENTNCYLSGESINLYENNYSLDHIIPSSRGGDNSIDNLGITHKIVNIMKSDLTVDELMEWCIKILNHNGYKISK